MSINLSKNFMKKGNRYQFWDHSYRIMHDFEFKYVGI
jgi:hypothetical protein